MNILILSLLMAFGGQTTNSAVFTVKTEPEPSVMCEYGSRGAPGKCSDGVRTVEFPVTCFSNFNRPGSFGECYLTPILEISLHPYPLWRIEAQEPGIVYARDIPNADVVVKDIQLGDSNHLVLCGLNTTDDSCDKSQTQWVKTPIWVEHNYDPINVPASPIDVPAVHEPDIRYQRTLSNPGAIWCNFDTLNGTPECFQKRPMLPTCSDPSRSLESSVDGLKHWCHRMTD